MGKVAPKAKKQESVIVYDDTKILSRMDTLESHFGTLKDTVNLVKNTNWFTLIVLFVGFIALLITMISGVIQATNSSASSQVELTKSIEKLQLQLNNLQLNQPPSNQTSTSK